MNIFSGYMSKEEQTKVQKFKDQYAGKRSERFWSVINSLPELERIELQTAGCLLQNMEDSILKLLNGYIDEHLIKSNHTKDQQDEHEGNHFIQLGEMNTLNRIRRIERILYKADLSKSYPRE